MLYFEQWRNFGSLVWKFLQKKYQPRRYLIVILPSTSSKFIFFADGSPPWELLRFIFEFSPIDFRPSLLRIRERSHLLPLTQWRILKRSIWSIHCVARFFNPRLLKPLGWVICNSANSILMPRNETFSFLFGVLFLLFSSCWNLRFLPKTVLRRVQWFWKKTDNCFSVRCSCIVLPKVPWTKLFSTKSDFLIELRRVTKSFEEVVLKKGAVSFAKNFCPGNFYGALLPGQSKSISKRTNLFAFSQKYHTEKKNVVLMREIYLVKSFWERKKLKRKMDWTLKKKRKVQER